MKIGDKVRVRGDDNLSIYSIRKIENGWAAVENVISKRHAEFELDKLYLTAMNPVIFITTYGKDWKENVFNILKKEKIKFTTVGKGGIITEIYVDNRKLDKAKTAYDKFYQKFAS